VRLQEAAQAHQIGAAVHLQGHAAGEARPRRVEVEHRICHHPRAVGEVVVAGAALDHHQPLLGEVALAGFECLAEHRHLDHRRVVIELNDTATTTRAHHRLEAGHDAGQHLRLARRLQVLEPRLDETLEARPRGLERMAGEVEPEDGLLCRQPLLVGPWRTFGQGRRRRCDRVIAEQAGLIGVGLCLLGHLHRQPDRGQHRCPFAVQRVECTAADQCLERLAVGQAPVDAQAQVEQAAERAIDLARRDDALDRTLADALDAAESIAHGPLAHRREAVAGGVDIGRKDGDSVLLGILKEHAQLVGVVHRRAHVGGGEGGRMVRLHVGGLVGDQRVGRGV